MRQLVMIFKQWDDAYHLLIFEHCHQRGVTPLLILPEFPLPPELEQILAQARTMWPAGTEEEFPVCVVMEEDEVIWAAANPDALLFEQAVDLTKNLIN